MAVAWRPGWFAHPMRIVAVPAGEAVPDNRALDNKALDHKAMADIIAARSCGRGADIS